MALLRFGTTRTAKRPRNTPFTTELRHASFVVLRSSTKPLSGSDSRPAAPTNSRKAFCAATLLLYAVSLMDQANIVIIGGGVVGCAIAHAVSRRWQDVFLVEQFPKLGMATSTRNSGVIHSGIYYPKNSLKARHCVEGNKLLYEFCAKHKVPFRHCGKLVVAADAHEE